MEKIEIAIKKAREVCHPITIGMTKEDEKIVKAYHTALDNFIVFLEKIEEPTKKISIPFSEEDLQELQNGETFDWNFDGVDVHLFMGDNEE